MRRRKTSAEPLDEAALYEYALRALGHRMRTAEEIKRMLRTRVEHDPAGEEKITSVITRLEQRRYLDDRTYAATYARLRRENDGLGQGRVLRDLRRKGIAAEEAEAALEAVYAGTSEADLVRQFLARKRLTEPHTPSEKARILRRLMTAGFSYSAISTVLKAWQIDIDETDLPSRE